METKLTLRTIEAADNPAMAQIIRTVMQEFAAVGEGYSINDPEVDMLFETYDRADSVFYVLLREGRVVGGGGIAPLVGGPEGVCELKKMYFLPEIRGLGWGKKMVLACLEAARDLGYRQCYLETIDRMTGANILYQKLGFKKLDRAMGNTGHSSCEAWYVKDL